MTPTDRAPITWLTHVRVRLALHHLRDGSGRPLLLLHGLGEASPDAAPDWAEAWPGAVLALDFTGHGDSTVPVGGGYTAELLLADADIALAHVGAATVVFPGASERAAVLQSCQRMLTALDANPIAVQPPPERPEAVAPGWSVH